MRALSLIIFSVTSVIALSACQADDLEKTFVARCTESFGEKVSAPPCLCIFKGLDGEFSDDQLLRISDLFTMNIPDGQKMLQKSGSQSDLQISERIHDIEVVTETCFKQSR